MAILAVRRPKHKDNPFSIRAIQMIILPINCEPFNIGGLDTHFHLLIGFGNGVKSQAFFHSNLSFSKLWIIQEVIRHFITAHGGIAIQGKVEDILIHPHIDLGFIEHHTEACYRQTIKMLLITIGERIEKSDQLVGHHL